MAKKKQDTRLSAEAIFALRQSSYESNSFALAEENLRCYGEIKALVECLGGKWNKGKRRLEFGKGVDAQSLVYCACDRGSIPASNPNDFFPTPANLVEQLTGDDDFAGQWAAKIISADMDGDPIRYLEPSGGAGALVEAIVAKMRPQDSLTVVELNPLLADGLRKRFPQATVIEGDFLEFKADQQFDVALINPPFAGKGYQKHVRHAFSMLSEMGILAAIVPSSVVTHGDEFLYFIAEAGSWKDFGGEHFEGTDTATTGLWLQNDPQRNWREKAHEGYATHHAWSIAIAATSDSEWISEMLKCRTFADFQDNLARHVSRQLRDGSAGRVDEAIALDVLQSLVGDYGADFGLEKLGNLLPPVNASKVSQLTKMRERSGPMEQMDLLQNVA